MNAVSLYHQDTSQKNIASPHRKVRIPRLMKGEEMLRDTPKIDWFVRDVFPRLGFGVAYSKPGVGKTHFVLGLLFHLAHGLQILDAVNDPIPVCYVAGEGNSGVRDRYEALLTRHGIEASEDENMIFTDGPTELSDPAAIQGLIDGIKEMLAGREIGVVAIDTLARNFTGDENDAASMKILVDGCEEIVKTFKCLVILVHHAKKGNKTEFRGSGALEGAIDVTYAVEKSDQGIDVVIEKLRFGRDNGRIKCLLEPVELEPDEDGMEREAPVLSFASFTFEDGTSKPTRSLRKTGGGNQDIALGILKRGPISEKEWREKFILQKNVAPEKSKRAFREAV
ncbi:AAA family ATPase, partial [Thalassospira lucentensis]|uniref:AAA family ATPase n=1 Tax=Thalassospira lucentensis TaxID=168935 RepID=UPI003AA949FC